eukprot:COSAG06_NODE_13104_length_1292_cov_1.801341_1_plen_343_part_01
MEAPEWSDRSSSINDYNSSGTSDEEIDEPIRPEELHERWQRDLMQGPPSATSDGMADSSPTDSDHDLVGAMRAVFMKQPVRCDDESAHEKLRPVPEGALTALKRSLAGPRSSRDATVRLWTFFGCYHGFCGGYGAYIFIKNFHDDRHYGGLMLSSVPIWGGVGILAGEATAQMARVLVETSGGGGGGGENLLSPEQRLAERAGTGSARSTNLTFMLRLLHSPVSAGVADRIAGKIRWSRGLAAFFIVPLLYCYVGMLWMFATGAPAGTQPFVGVDWFLKTVLGVGALCCFPCAMLLSGWSLFITVPCLVVSDRISREVKRVKRLQQQQVTTISAEEPAAAAAA